MNKTLNNTQLYVVKLKEIHEILKELPEAQWHMDKLTHYTEGLFTRFCPLKVGDKAFISAEIPIESSSGWINSKHFLVVGAQGTITEVDFSDMKFIYGFKPSYQSFFNTHDKEVACKELYTFHLSEDYITPTPRAQANG